MADEIIEAVRTVPAYSRPLDGDFGEGIRRGVHEALRNFLAEIEAGGPVARPDVYRMLGRGEVRAGRTLESLLSAYRAGARVAWRRFADAGRSAGLEPEILYLLAESIFAYIDALSAESADGYAIEQSAAVSEAEIGRRRLVRMLVREPSVERSTLEVAAREAAWQLPRTLAVLAIAGAYQRSFALVGPDVIADTIGELTCAIVPDPEAPGRRVAIARELTEAGAVAGLGTTVPVTEAAVSFERARAALALASEDGAGPVVVARANAGALLLRSNPGLAREFASDRLGPLLALSPGPRTRLTATLEAWLAEQGRLSKVADRLGVHPQTVRYRLGRLRELYGDRLDDPDERFWLAVALRVQGAGER